MNIFQYEIPSFMEGIMNPLGHQSQTIISSSMSESSIIRSVGVSGTHYASSALTAATAIYFFVLRKKLLFFVSLALLIFWGVGTSLLSLIAYILFLKRKSQYIPFLLVGLTMAAFWIINNRGFDFDVYFTFINNFSNYDIYLAILFGEGKFTSSMQSELRIISLFFSLGICGFILIFTMISSYYKYSCYICNSKTE